SDGEGGVDRRLKQGTAGGGPGRDPEWVVIRTMVLEPVAEKIRIDPVGPLGWALPLRGQIAELAEPGRERTFLSRVVQLGLPKGGKPRDEGALLAQIGINRGPSLCTEDDRDEPILVDFDQTIAFGIRRRGLVQV